MSNTFTEGEAFAPQRSLFNALGFTKEEMRKPLVGIVSSYNEIVPGHMNIDKIVDAVKLGVAMAGGTPVVFPAIAVCDGIAMGHVGMKYSLVTRDLIDKTLVEIEKGNTITRTTADAFNQIITDMESFAELAENTMEKANSQAESLEQIGQGIEQLSGVVQGNAASSEENTAISINLAEGAAKMHDRVNIFKLF